ncbi:MAG TPA: hypothetical protein VLA34_13780, partial [Candidatus Krumholzibacterium sp.]|nr:hypothetical protein [Candidatus Krumholzibacterium sp.]
MEKKTKRMMTVLAVIVLVVVAASVVLRVLLTRERLIAMIVPRIEKKIDAKISVGDMGVRFPFGFGVQATDLSFEKALPRGGRLVVSSSKTAVDVSLVSLIRKRPDVKRVDVDGAKISLSGAAGTSAVELADIRGQFSMLPADSVYVIGADLKIASV